MKSTIESNRQDSDEKMNNITEDLTKMITSMMDWIKISRSSPEKKDSPKAQYYTTVVPSKKKAQQLEGGNSKKNGGMWTLKHEIRSP